MTSRERWTVYPLLFLAIGLALRAATTPPSDVVVDSLEAGRVVCGEIVVASDDGTKLVHIGRVKGGGGGRIEISDRTGAEAVAVGTGPEGRDGSVEFFDGAGATTGIVDAATPATPAR